MERLGLKERPQLFTVFCPVCKEAFDGEVTIKPRLWRAPELLISTLKRPDGN
jgi:hypothetical protein